MKLDEFDYDLPPELIAQEPLAERATSRLMIVDRKGERPPEHRTFSDLAELIEPGTVLVMNETRVLPARFWGQRATGGKVEVLLVRRLKAEPIPEWEAMVRSGGNLRPDEVISLADGKIPLTLLEQTTPGRYRVRFPLGMDPEEAMEQHGRMPLPPYIKREVTPSDRKTYQTVFARVPGAIAAPTAGLHFTPGLIRALQAKDVILAPIVLHVGPGTFTPIRGETIEDHVMEEERFAISPATQECLLKARSEGRKIMAVGTTCVRALETFARFKGPKGATDLFVYPGFEFHMVEGLITNFHLPKSTLLLLVSAFAGREHVLKAYEEAVEKRYRFYSYGDSMFIR